MYNQINLVYSISPPISIVVLEILSSVAMQLLQPIMTVSNLFVELKEVLDIYLLLVLRPQEQQKKKKEEHFFGSIKPAENSALLKNRHFYKGSMNLLLVRSRI